MSLFTQRKLYFVILNWLFLITTLTLGNKIYKGYRNNLYVNGNWESTKVGLDKYVMGAADFVLTKTALANNRLNLGAWHGYQEVSFKQQLNLSYIQFDFKLSTPSCFSFIYNKDSAGFSGIRISTDTLFSDIHFLADADGRFLYKEVFQAGNVMTDEWNSAKISFDDNKIKVFINGELCCQFDASYSGGQTVGFRGLDKEVLIDNVILKEKDAANAIVETFENQHHGFRQSSLLLLTIIFIPFFFYLAQSILMYMLLLQLPLSFGMGVLFCYFFEVHQKVYPADPEDLNWSLLEGLGEANGETKVIEKIDAEYPLKTDSNAFRILFIGSSQTYGAGASKESKTIVKIFEKLLNADPNGQRKYECINTGISGFVSNKLLDLYQRHWLRLDPDLVIVNLSNNDTEFSPNRELSQPGMFSSPDGDDAANSEFANNLDSILSVNQLLHIKTVFVLEPNALYSPNMKFLVKNHETMKRVGRSHEVIVVDMHTYLLNRYDDGFLWWDFVHLSDYGQKLFAEKLKNDITGLL